VKLVRRIPRGKVATYGQIAVLAGNAYASRQVARLLHSLSGKEKLPWQRVINSRGTISLPAQAGERQRSLLEREGVQFGLHGRVELARYLWLGSGERASRAGPRAAGRSKKRSTGRPTRRPANRPTRRAPGNGTG
jgi:methylated-DNA-protein-cysteine methyltransferase-like protein